MIRGDQQAVYPESSVFAGRFEIVSPLGSGACGEVYRARDRDLWGEPVALKILSSPHRENKRVMERFRNEVLVARTLVSPNIVQIFEFAMDRERNLPFIVMELVDGIDLREHVERSHKGRLPEDEVLRIATDVLSGLAAAHRRGVIHRDLKPENILLSGDGTAKITDFGTARLLEAEYRITRTAERVGTPLYSSPEQLHGDPVGPSSDVYSTGVVLFELLAGEPPFSSETFFEVALQHLAKPPPLERLNRRGVSDTAIAFIERCLAKSPEERFANGSDALDELKRISPVAVRDPGEVPEAWVAMRSRHRRLRRKRSLRLFSAVAVACMLTGAAFSMVLSRVVPRAALVFGEGILVLEEAYGISLGTVKRALDVDISKSRPEDLFPLLVSPNPRDRALFHALLSSGADPDVQIGNGDSIAHYAIRHRGTELLDKIYKAGFNFGVRDRAGLTPFTLSMSRGDFVSSCLLAFYHPFLIHDADGNRSIHITVREGSDGVADCMLKEWYGTRLSNSRNGEGQTPLHMLMLPANPWNDELARMLLNSGADPNRRTPSGETPLLLALRVKSIDRAYRFLQLTNGIDLNAADPGGRTALSYAIDMNEHRMIRILLRRGAELAPGLGPERIAGLL